MLEPTDNKGVKTTVPEHGAGKSAAALTALFNRVEGLLADSGGDLQDEQERFAGIQARLAKSRFHLAVLGQFKRGKSTFLNALLGERLLPSAVVPLTSVPTFISWAADRTVRVTYNNGRSEEFTALDAARCREMLSSYVTEEKNPHNRLGVASVEVGYPSPLLNNGVVLIDTPGIGSTFDHNTEATMKFIPQCDAAFCLVSADPPITQVELEFFKLIKSRVVRLFFIMNKIDYLSSSERNEAVSFLNRVLREKLGIPGDVPIFSVSSRQGLEARLNSDDGLLKSSGMADIEAHLVNFLVEQKSHTLHIALTRKVQDIVNDAIMQLELQQKSLTLPVEDLEKRLSVFQQKLREAEQKQVTFKDLLAGDKNRTIELINEQAGVLYKSYTRQLCDEVDRIIASTKHFATVENDARQYISEVVPQVFNRELEKIATEMDEHINRIIGSYQQQLLDLVETVRKTAADIFDIGYARSFGQEILEMKHEPFWVTESWRVNWSPLPENWFENLLPVKTRAKRLRKRLVEDIDSIISNNVGNLRWATVCNITDSFYAFGLELDRQIKRAIESTSGAITAAHRKRTEQSAGIGPEISRLASMIDLFKKVRSDLSEFESSLSGQGH